MKRSVPKRIALLAILSLFAGSTAKAQLGIGLGTYNACSNSATNLVVATVTAPLSGTTIYTWSINGACGQYVGSSASSATFNLGCAGNFTINCTALGNPTTSVLGTTMETLTVASAPNVSVVSAVPGSTGCAGTSFTINAGGAMTYTIAGPGGPFASNMAIVSPSVNTCYTISGTGSNGCISQTVQCLSVIGLPSVSVTPNMTICAGNTTSLIASGANSYLWSNNATGSAIGVSPSVTTCYTVQGTNGCGNDSAFVCVTVVPGNVSIAASSSVLCLGGTATLTASGASSYTWSNMTFGGSTVVSPSTSMVYTVVGTNSLGCQGIAVQPVIVHPNPVVTAATNAQSVCAGMGATLSAGGAVSYTWSTNQVGATIVVYPIANTCYTVTGSNSNGCTSSSVVCVNAQFGPALSINGDFSVCLGSSATMTASGAGSYAWSNSFTGPVNTIMPLTTDMYTVISTGANGCVGTATHVVIVDTTCSDVWPGDANSDGIVNSSDIVQLGVAFSATGAARTPGGNNFIAQHATNWSGTMSNGKNVCHSDCNGDGVVNMSDTVAVFNNFALTHAFKPSGASSNPDVNIVANPVAYAGSWNVADIVAGDASTPLSNVYGLTFEVDFDPSMIEAGSVYLVFSASFMNAGTQNVIFRKPDFSTGKIYAVTVRTDGNMVNGNGKIGELHYKLKNSLAENQQISFAVNNVQKADNTGALVAGTSGSTSQSVTFDLVGLYEPGSRLEAGVWPNPASGMVVFSTGVQTSYTLADITGRVVNQGAFTSTTALSTNDLPAGTYFVTFSTSKGSAVKKIVVVH